MSSSKRWSPRSVAHSGRACKASSSVAVAAALNLPAVLSSLMGFSLPKTPLFWADRLLYQPLPPEGRINRIGQTAGDTFAWYLLGADTIDERVWKIIEAKRALFRAGAEGKGAPEVEQAVTTELLNIYRLAAPPAPPRPHITDLAHLVTIIPIGRGA